MEGRDYEPAAVLLEQIRSARAASDNGQAARRRAPSSRKALPVSAEAQAAAAQDMAGPREADTGGMLTPRRVAANAATGNREKTVVSSPTPIDETNRDKVLAVIRQVFADGARRDRATAIRDVAHALGYHRTGARIQDVLDTDLLTAVRRGILENERGELRLVCRSAGDYTLDHRVEMLLAAMGGSWQTRDEAITAAARHLGFRRTGPAIRAALKSAINARLRRGRLESDGADLIRKMR